MKYLRKSRTVAVLSILTVGLTLFLFTYSTKRIHNHNEDVSITKRSSDLASLNVSTPTLSAAIEHSRGGREALLVTLVNDAFLPFTLSWLCNTRDMGIHSQVLFITGDSESTQRIKGSWPEVGAVQIDGVHPGDQEYSRVGYVELMVRRSEILLQILEKNIPIFLFEVDCLWISNPLSNLMSYRNVDIVVNAVSQRTNVIAGGFLYLHPTEASKNLWRALTVQLNKLGMKIRNSPKNAKVSESDNDQVYLSNLVFSNYGGLRYKVLSNDDYADGNWYKLSKERRMTLRKPYLINNNWVVGNAAKNKRAKEWGHWFLTENGECDEEKIQRVVKQGQVSGP